MCAALTHLVLCNLRFSVKLVLMILRCVFAENSTTVIGNPLEDASVWFWNNTDMVNVLCFILFNEGINSRMNI